MDKKKTNLLIIGIFISITVSLSVFSYYANQPVFTHNYIEDDFEDKIPGIFPIGWLSAVHPFNVRVVNDNGNNVMEVKDTGVNEVTEIVRRFKKTSIGVIECKVKALDTNSGFVIHIPQLDREYNPYDDIIIFFLKGYVYVIGEDNIIYLEDVDPSFLDQLVLTIDEGTLLIDEWNLDNYEPVYEYEANEWYDIRIDFNRERFLLSINETSLGEFSYPKYSPPYFASLYFWTAIEPSNFKFYIDNVKITLSQSVDYIHPANIVLLVIIPISVIVIYIRFQKKKSKRKRR